MTFPSAELSKQIIDLNRAFRAKADSTPSFSSSLKIVLTGFMATTGDDFTVSLESGDQCIFAGFGNTEHAEENGVACAFLCRRDMGTVVLSLCIDTSKRLFGEEFQKYYQSCLEYGISSGVSPVLNYGDHSQWA